jgi:response regulator RpfG family c-di-GMP phosphodiesterase
MSEAPDRPVVLLVDDDAHVLASLTRALHGQPYEVATAADARDAVAILTRRNVDVLVSDLRMPGADGNALLALVRERWPDTVRMLMTGHAEVGPTIAAINRGEVYRYILKPWDAAELRGVIGQGVERAQLKRERDALHAQTVRQAAALREANATLEERVLQRTAELREAHASLQDANERLRQSFLNSIRVFTALLELRGKQLAGHSRRVADLARRLATSVGMEPAEAQDVLIAALLHDIGKVEMSDAALRMPVAQLSGDAAATYRRHPERGEQALMAIEELRGASRLIRAHHERFDGRGFPDGLAGESIPFGARILAIVDDYDDLVSGSQGRAMDPGEAMGHIVKAAGSRYDPGIVERFRALLEQPSEAHAPCSELRCHVAALRPGDVVARDILTSDGMLLLAAGHVLQERVIDLLRGYERREQLELTVHVKREEQCAA